MTEKKLYLLTIIFVLFMGLLFSGFINEVVQADGIDESKFINLDPGYNYPHGIYISEEEAFKKLTEPNKIRLYFAEENILEITKEFNPSCNHVSECLTLFVQE